ncbi:hypothetical protein ALC60_11148 [Trachymyrmex zeteki]|uniref:Uncharacterized protein n=1 Tax=Mycetomoellerius zeteki TaxID=64791 RepID=A0A151WPE0_9HYME|nr:hypothetical protein ALC60_11148 [Trachymyrmex zeteki]
MAELVTIDEGLYYVIKFFDGIQIISDNWVIQDETLVYWPKVKLDKEYDVIVYTRSPVKNDWSLEPIKTILYRTAINNDICQILKGVESLKTSINGITYLIREVIQRLDVLEKKSELSLKVQSTVEEYNSLVSIFPIQTIASLKEVETKIKNNSIFKTKLVNFILFYLLNAHLKKYIMLYLFARIYFVDRKSYAS